MAAFETQEPSKVGSRSLEVGLRTKWFSLFSFEGRCRRIKEDHAPPTFG